MDERIDQHASELDQAIDASRTGDADVDAGPFGETVDRLRAFAESGPPLEELRMKRRIENDVRKTPQRQPWWRQGWSRPAAGAFRRPGSLGKLQQRLATGAAIAALAIAVGVGSLLTTSSSASAAFLENVQALSALAEAATGDGILDEDEAAAIAALIEELQTEAGDGSLSDLDQDDLAEAALLLAAIEATLDEHDGDDNGIEEVAEAVVAALAGDDDHDGEGVGDEGVGDDDRDDDRDDDNDGEGVGDEGVGDDDRDHDESESAGTSFSEEEIQAALAALAQLEADVDAFKFDADLALAQTLFDLESFEATIAAAEADALALIGTLPDPSELSSEEDLETIEAAIEELDNIFEHLDEGIDELIEQLDDAFDEIEKQAEKAIESFEDDHRYARDDAEALVDGLDDHLDESKAEARAAVRGLDELKAAIEAADPEGDEEEDDDVADEEDDDDRDEDDDEKDDEKDEDDDEEDDD